MRVICVHLRKGGSGKTTTAVNLAAALAKLGKNVLLIDLDGQANASQALGITDISGLKTTTHVLSGDCDLTAAAIKPNTLKIKPNAFKLIPASRELVQIEAAMVQNPAEFAPTLKNLLAELKANSLIESKYPYDFVVIDTPPNEALLTINALVACDLAILPVWLQYLAFAGLNLTLELAGRVQAAYTASFAVRMLPVGAQHTNMSRSSLRRLRADYAEALIDIVIPYSIKVSESQLFGRPLIDFKPGHKISKAYTKLAKQIIKGKI